MIDFSKAYSRADFVNYLRRDFLPDDFEQEESNVPFWAHMNYASSATCLGKSKTLDLVVYEIKHTSRHDARVSLSKDAFRMLAGEKQPRALVIFVPEDDANNYRFSLIEIQLSIGENDSNVTRTYSNPRRYSYYLGKGIACYTPNKYLNELGRVKDVKDLFDRFSVEVLTKAFYQELSDWYAWAIKVISFPNDITKRTDDKLHNHEGAIRLITRLIFVWFLKERKLIPWQFFDQEYIANHLIKGFNPHKIDNLFGKSEASVYYRAILQNLFFAMLNCPITKDGSTELTERRFKDNRSQFDDNKLMRYRDEFNDPDEFLRLANETVPFLNGGLFDCLDEKRTGMYYDGFSERKESMAQLIVPDYLFFGEEAGKNIDLSEFYGDANKKKVSARGIIDILKRYNFTVEENMPFDKDVSLDPELLGKVFENLLASYNPETQQTARKQTGSFYTPREIVQYMVDESLVAHLKRTVGDELENEYRKLLAYADSETVLTEQQKLAIMQSLYNCKILDPACGSGAFPVGVLQQMVHILKQIDPDNSRWKNMLLQFAIDETSEAYLTSTAEERREAVADIERAFDENVNYPDYARKLHLIENCIYGVDIQPIAIQISKLRFFISLVIDQKRNDNPADNFGIRPLPNLEAKFVAANSLLGLKKTEATLFDSAEIKQKDSQLKIAKHKIFSARRPATKEKWRKEVVRLRQEIADLLLDKDCIGNEQAAQLAQWDMFDQNSFAPFFDPEWMFGVKEGFDILIANPPYISTKGVSTADKKLFEAEFGFSDDTYNLFFFKGFSLLCKGGCITYITPKTFWTTQTKRNLRDLLLANTLNYVFDTANPFEAVMVDTCITSAVKNKPAAENLVRFMDGRKNLSQPECLIVAQSVYLNTQNSVIFKPSALNMRIYELYGEKVKALYDKWWDKIKTSRDIEKNKRELEEYRASLKPGDVALLGCLTEGGQGLATANNGKYIAVRSTTKWADNIRMSRPKKLADFLARTPKAITAEMYRYPSYAAFLQSLSEAEIAELFDSLKEQYGRDIFGQGYLYKIVDDCEIANVDSLTDDEKENGIETTKPYYVPYDKGDKDGNRWYLETPFAIAWSKENVRFLKTNSGKKGEGMPVVRNPQFYFREGFCWIDVNSTYLKARIKANGVFDVLSMSLFTMTTLPDWYFVALINSEFISLYVDNFINNTSHFQINDARQLPIIIPKKETFESLQKLVANCISLKKTATTDDFLMGEKQYELDRLVRLLYRVED